MSFHTNIPSLVPGAVIVSKKPDLTGDFVCTGSNDAAQIIAAFTYISDHSGYVPRVVKLRGQEFNLESNIPITLSDVRFTAEKGNRLVINSGVLGVTNNGDWAVVFVNTSGGMYRTEIDNLHIVVGSGNTFSQSNPDEKGTGITVSPGKMYLAAGGLLNGGWGEDIHIHDNIVEDAYTCGIAVLKVKRPIVENNKILRVVETSGRDTRKGITSIYNRDIKYVNNLVDFDPDHANWYGSSNGIFSFIGGNWSGYNTATVGGQITDNTIWGSIDSAIEIHGGDNNSSVAPNEANNIDIKGNIVYGRSIIVSRNVKFTNIIGNIVEYQAGGSDQGAGGIVVNGLGSGDVISLRDILVEGNIIYCSSPSTDELREGIKIATNGNQEVRDITVVGNHVEDIGEYGGSELGYGITVEGGDKPVLSGGMTNIIIKDNTVKNASKYGIYITDVEAGADIELTNNTIVNPGYTGNLSYGVIVNSGDTCNLVMQGNNIYDNQPTMTMTYAVVLEGDISGSVNFNRVRSGLSGAISVLSGVTTSVMEQNIIDYELKSGW